MPPAARPARPDSSSLELADDELVTLWGQVVEGMAATARILGDEVEGAVGLPVTWVEVLFRLRRTPGETLPTTQLAREVSFSSGGFTKLMDRLVQAGLVDRQPCPTDRRVVYAVLTDRGREAADRALAVHVDGLRRHILATVSLAGLRELSSTMRLLRDALSATHSRGGALG